MTIAEKLNRVCINCSHSKSDHSGGHLCTEQDDEEPEYPCTCDEYASEPVGNVKFCDDCLLVAYDNVGMGTAEQYDFLQVMGPQLDEHECSAVIEPEIRCDCGGHRR